MRKVPTEDALRLLALGLERRACTAELALLEEKHRHLTTQRDAVVQKIRTILTSHRLDPDKHAVVTSEDAGPSFCAAVDAQTGEPLADEESSKSEILPS